MKDREAGKTGKLGERENRGNREKTENRKERKGGEPVYFLSFSADDISGRRVTGGKRAGVLQRGAADGLQRLAGQKPLV